MTAAKNAEPIAIGAILAGTYRLDAVLGRGGMGVVYRASHQRLPKSYAVKVLLPEGGQDPAAFRRFQREAEIASSIGHPGIIEVHDFNRTDDGVPFIVMELLEGESLAARCAREPPSLEEALRFTREIASALSAAHAIGVVHRDLKPQNVFVARRGGREQLKILDFGISKIQGAQSVQTRSETLMGTPGYMSPEQARGDAKEADARADQFALAAIAYELISGRPAFYAPGDSPYGVIYKIVNHQPPPLVGAPPSVVAAIMRALSKDPEERFPTLEAFVAGLEGRGEAGPAAMPTGTITESVPPQAAAMVRRRMRGVFVLSAIVTVALAAIALWVAFSSPRRPIAEVAPKTSPPVAPAPVAPELATPPVVQPTTPPPVAAPAPSPTLAPVPSSPTPSNAQPSSPTPSPAHADHRKRAPKAPAPAASKPPPKPPTPAPSSTSGPAPAQRRPPPELEPLPE